jgi:hypothetical protein
LAQHLLTFRQQTVHCVNGSLVPIPFSEDCSQLANDT